MEVGDQLMRRDPAFNRFLKEIVDRIDHPSAQGVTRQVIHQGVDSLTAKQAYVFENYVLDRYTLDHCEYCYHEIPWEEMAFAMDISEGRCSWCYNVRMKGAA